MLKRFLFGEKEAKKAEESWLKNHDSFCMMPFVHLHVTQHGTVTPCCQTPWDDEASFGNVNSSTIDEIWHGEAMNTFRGKMMRGERDDRCARCYEKEASGWKTLRQITNENFKHHFYRVTSANSDGSLTDPRLAKPVYYDLRFSNVCNYRCRICGPWSSSKWHKDAKEIGMTDNESSQTHAVPDSEILLHQFEANIDQVEEVYFAGGEPLIMDEHYKMLEILVKHGKRETRLMYNTNFSLLKHKHWEALGLWKHFDHINIAASLDAMGPRGELLRKEQVWDEVLQNITSLKRQLPHVKFMISPTVYTLNIQHLTDFHVKMVEQGYIDAEDFVPSLLIQPEYYNIQCLPSELKQTVSKNIEHHVSWLQSQPAYNKEKMAYVKQTYRNLVRHMHHNDRSELLPDLKKRTAALDILRAEPTVSIFPELRFLRDIQD